MRDLITAIGLAGVMVAAAAAQTAFPEKQEKGKATTAKGTTMVVTGCVAAAPAGGGFVLTNGMTAGDTTGRTYQLMGGDVQGHVGHEVEITGAISTARKNGKNKSAPKLSGDAASQNNTAMSDPPGMLRVKSVKMVANTCS
jgi:hypothetical protein